MPHGELTIYNYENTYDAWDEWGVSLEDGAYGTLLAPPAVKARVENSSRLEKGKRIIATETFYDSREVTLEMHLYAPGYATFLTRYRAFLAAINGRQGFVMQYRPYGQTLYFKVMYLSCTQFAAYNGTLAKFSLRLVEPQPNLGVES